MEGFKFLLLWCTFAYFMDICIQDVTSQSTTSLTSMIATQSSPANNAVSALRSAPPAPPPATQTPTPTPASTTATLSTTTTTTTSPTTTPSTSSTSTTLSSISSSSATSSAPSSVPQSSTGDNTELTSSMVQDHRNWTVPPVSPGTKNSYDKQTVGNYVGAAVAGMAFVILIIFLVFVVFQCRKKKALEEAEQTRQRELSNGHKVTNGHAMPADQDIMSGHQAVPNGHGEYAYIPGPQDFHMQDEVNHKDYEELPLRSPVSEKNFAFDYADNVEIEPIDPYASTHSMGLSSRAGSHLGSQLAGTIASRDSKSTVSNITDVYAVPMKRKSEQQAS